MYLTKKLSAFASAALIALFVAGSPVSANDCSPACSKYVACVGEVTQKQPTQEQRNQLTQGCLKTCAKHPKETIACYKNAIASANSCSAYSACIQKNFSK